MSRKCKTTTIERPQSSSSMTFLRRRRRMRPPRPGSAQRETDNNSGDLNNTTTDGFPSDDDQPDVFLPTAPMVVGSRWTSGELVEVERVNAYSSTSLTRTVLTSYASDGSRRLRCEAGQADPEKAGWKLIASVDTRPKLTRPADSTHERLADPGGGAWRIPAIFFSISRAPKTRIDSGGLSARSTLATGKNT